MNKAKIGKNGIILLSIIFILIGITVFFSFSSKTTLPENEQETNTDIIAAKSDDNESFFQSIIDSFYKTFIKEARWKQFAKGLGTTLIICICSIIIGTVLGIYAAMLCYNGDKLANGIMSVLCEIFDSLPSVVLLMIVYYIIFSKINVSNIAVSIVTFSLMFCCSVYGTVKTGMNAIGIGQYEAARAQGFSSVKTFLFIIFPQICVNQLPAYQSNISSVIQETSIVGYIAVADLTKISDIIRGKTCEPFLPLIVTAIIYYLTIKLIVFGVGKLMKNIDIKTRKPEKKINKLKDL